MIRAVLCRASAALALGAACSVDQSIWLRMSAAQDVDPCPRGTAVVTGGSRGIGAACCREFATQGWQVVVVYRAGESAANTVVRDICASGGRAISMQADVGQEDDVVDLFSRVDAWRGSSPLTALVNNAGVLGSSKVAQPAKQTLQESTAEHLLELLATNVAGPLVCTREAEKRMSTAKGGQGGSVVQVSSGSAYIGTPLLYASSKGALNSLTIGLVKPLAQVGIRINSISPGMTATDMTVDTMPTFDMSQIPLGRAGARRLPCTSDTSPPTSVHAPCQCTRLVTAHAGSMCSRSSPLLVTLPCTNAGTPEEMAKAICWLCKEEESSYVAGANMRIAGGRPPGTTLG